MRILESAENYLETVLQLTERNGSVRSIDIANELNFSKPSVSVAMKNLRKHGYLKVDSKGYITLTEKGYKIAKTMNERHVLLRDWLISLGVNEETAYNDACRIEHVISAETFEAIKRHAGLNESD
jgi:Mn-dependent DtxR family transcriptional regulator